jgi:hypothetical protein
MSVVVKPSASEAFTPHELAATYEEFIRRDPQYVSSETGVRASAYHLGTRVLVAYEEPETGLVVLLSPTV